jgi:uncharacterized membrane protein
MSKNQKFTLYRTLPWILLIGGIIGVFCAGVLTSEKIQLLKHPASQLGCDLNPIVACGPVINTPQASAFGVPNPFLGLAGFAVVATVGAAMLAGAAFRRWFWLSLQAGTLFAAGFVTWLQFETIFRIGALCPYCMVVWAVTIPIFWYTTLYNLREGHIKVSPKLKNFVLRHHGDILAGWYLIIIAVILNHFWYYWKTLF